MSQTDDRQQTPQEANALLPLDTRFRSCKELHYGSCFKTNLQVLSVIFYRAFRVYFAIHFLPGLLFRRAAIFSRSSLALPSLLVSCLVSRSSIDQRTPRSRDKVIKWLDHSTMSTIRSSLFLSCYSTLFTSFVCFARNLTHT